MAEITYDSILSSKPYCFLVGPREREFFIHASLAANKSPVLDSVVNGRMNEEANGCAVWRHVDEDTFVRFGQYVYTGDYEGSAPSHPVPDAPPEPVAEEEEPQAEPENVVEEAVATSPVREPAQAVELDAVVERVPDDQVVPEKDVWGFFTSRAKVGGDYDWGFGATRAKPVEEEAWVAPVREPEPEPEPRPIDDDDLSFLRSKKDKKKRKKRMVIIESEPAPAEAVVELAMEEEKPLEELDADFWTGRPVAAARAPSPAPAPPPPPAPKRSAAWHSFTTNLRYEPGRSAAPFHAPDNETDSALAFAGVFLSHARVHALADEYRVEPLAQLALHKLHRILCAFTLHEARIGDVVALLRYSYGEPGEALRVLASAFAACHLKTMWTSAAFRELFAGCGELALAIVGHVIERLD